MIWEDLIGIYGWCHGAKRRDAILWIIVIPALERSSICLAVLKCVKLSRSSPVGKYYESECDVNAYLESEKTVSFPGWSWGGVIPVMVYSRAKCMPRGWERAPFFWKASVSVTVVQKVKSSNYAVTLLELDEKGWVALGTALKMDHICVSTTWCRRLSQHDPKALKEYLLKG